MVPAEGGDKHHDWYSGELPSCVFWTNSPSLLVNRYALKSTSTSKFTIWSRRYYVHISYFLFWPHSKLGCSNSWSPLSWYQWLLDSLQTLGGCLKDFSHIAIDVRSLFPSQAGKEEVESRKPFENLSDSPPSPKIRTSSCWNWAPDISTAGLLIVRRWVKEGEIDPINHQQTWQWGFTVHPVNKSPVSRVSPFKTNTHPFTSKVFNLV